MSKKTHTPPRFSSFIERVLLLERLREVNALIGFTRVEAPEESDDPSERVPMANLSRNRPDWVPASQVHGEGIFLQFNEEALVAWESLDAVKKLTECSVVDIPDGEIHVILIPRRAIRVFALPCYTHFHTY
ncbi:hypothetical protein IC615_07185 [Serratia ureilytica]